MEFILRWKDKLEQKYPELIGKLSWEQSLEIEDRSDQEEEDGQEDADFGQEADFAGNPEKALFAGEAEQ